jgi:hypothetical protein
MYLQSEGLFVCVYISLVLYLVASTYYTILYVSELLLLSWDHPPTSP